jgi:peptidoglycan/xylan/chitin deacetylase (PgdA/CDA1 family)
MILPWNWNMGTVVLSIDAELCWGFHDWNSPPQDRLASARSGWQSLLSLCDEFDIPATWAIVGHIMLEDCDGEHLEHPTPPGWFDHERGPDAYPRDWRFGQDLVEATRDAGVDHDIGSHTFSHVELGAPTTSHRLARAELAANITAARQWGVEPTSFVFPRNNVGNRRVLAAYGFRCYRGVRPDEQQTEPITRRFRKLARGTVRTEPPPIVRPKIDSYGLVNVPASLFLFGFEGTARSVLTSLTEDPIVRQAKRGIDAAADSDGVFHMWLHPNNITTDQDVDRVRTIFSHLERRRNATDLQVRTMADVADAAIAEHQWAELEPI